MLCSLYTTQLADGNYLHTCSRCGRETVSTSAKRVQQCRSRQRRRNIDKPCAHFGKPTGEVITCGTCTNSSKLKTFACKLHTVCTPRTAVGAIACCSGCKDYKMPTFDKCYVISLARRPDRLQQFTDLVNKQDWPFPKPEVFAAVDGKLANPPAWWKAGSGAWGCYRSHLQVIENCLTQNISSVLILEDDAIPVHSLAADWARFEKLLPGNWGMIYLGGQHLRKSHPPRTINEYWQVPWNVNRTHAYALRGETMRTVYKYLCDTTNWKSSQHIDHRLGALHQTGSLPLYSCTLWLFGQAEGRSDVSGKAENLRFWNRQRAGIVV